MATTTITKAILLILAMTTAEITMAAPITDHNMIERLL